jgi:hypothetical protein
MKTLPGIASIATIVSLALAARSSHAASPYGVTEVGAYIPYGVNATKENKDFDTSPPPAPPPNEPPKVEHPTVVTSPRASVTSEPATDSLRMPNRAEPSGPPTTYYGDGTTAP